MWLVATLLGRGIFGHNSKAALLKIQLLSSVSTQTRKAGKVDKYFITKEERRKKRKKKKTYAYPISEVGESRGNEIYTTFAYVILSILNNFPY